MDKLVLDLHKSAHRPIVIILSIDKSWQESRLLGENSIFLIKYKNFRWFDLAIDLHYL